ncbi:MAG TPA: arsenite methyltransferase [Ignavibacteria bacterium]|nr:arsenite methyltransferase [Ignavibacteria bacterium]
METTEIKDTVKKAYTSVLTERNTGCCGTECCSTGESMADDYTSLDGYVAEADYGLGCGIPTEYADIKKGDFVLDLGSGAGNDVFIASKTVGEKGKVIGLDMTEAMISKANSNKEKLGFKNVEFRFGEIENMPVDNDSIDVVLSNCVLNLVPEKEKAFSEIYRVLKNGGHFTISDIVISDDLPDKVRSTAELYAGCISGAVKKDEYLELISGSGFKDVKILKEKIIEISDGSMLKYISEDELEDYKKSKNRILSITVTGYKIS